MSVTATMGLPRRQGPGTVPVRSQARPSTQEASLISPYQMASVRCLLLERRVKMKKVKLTVFATVLAASVLATTAFASTKTSTIALKSTAVGKVLVGANGHTLYLFTADKGTKSVCYGQCATYWPPLIAGKPTAGAGLNPLRRGMTKAQDRNVQGTYHR